MLFLDREVPHCGGRSVRELLVVAGGLWIIISDLAVSFPPDVGNQLVYITATLLLALRFFAARAAAVGACIGAIVQQWPHLRLGEWDAETLAVVPIVGIALLASSDLVDRFERAPSRLSWLPNPWAGFTAAETRSLRWAAYAAGALSGLLDHTLQLIHWNIGLHAPAPLWPRVAMVALMLALALLCLGRAVGALLVWVTAVTVAVLAAPLAWRAEAVLRGTDPAAYNDFIYVHAAHYLLPVLLLATAAALITTPAVFRLLRRTVLG